jgi:hypothetical protein
LIILHALQRRFTDQSHIVNPLHNGKVEHLMIGHYVEGLEYRIGWPQERKGLG